MVCRYACVGGEALAAVAHPVQQLRVATAALDAPAIEVKRKLILSKRVQDVADRFGPHLARHVELEVVELRRIVRVRVVERARRRTTEQEQRATRSQSLHVDAVDRAAADGGAPAGEAAAKSGLPFSIGAVSWPFLRSCPRAANPFHALRALGWLVGPPLCALQASRCWLIGPALRALATP